MNYDTEFAYAIIKICGLILAIVLVVTFAGLLGIM
jgi:hypothetical protein